MRTYKSMVIGETNFAGKNSRILQILSPNALDGRTTRVITCNDDIGNNISSKGNDDNNTARPLQDIQFIMKDHNQMILLLLL